MTSVVSTEPPSLLDIRRVLFAICLRSFGWQEAGKEMLFSILCFMINTGSNCTANAANWEFYSRRITIGLPYRHKLCNLKNCYTHIISKVRYISIAGFLRILCAIVHVGIYRKQISSLCYWIKWMYSQNYYYSLHSKIIFEKGDNCLSATPARGKLFI